MEEEQLEGLVARAAAGDPAGWRAMWSDVEPWLAKLVANPQFLGRLGQREDDRNNILIEVMARLHADRFRRLAMYCETRRVNPQLRFKAWLRVVTKRVGIDYLRGHQDYARLGRAWIEPKTLPPYSQLAAERAPVTARGRALELLRFAEHAVGQPALGALELWTQSASFDEIARVLGLGSPLEAERLVRGVLERLRRHFREEVG